MTLPFPADCRGKEVEGVDLVMIDSVIVGCISTFIGENGNLDQQRLKTLKGSRNDLTAIIPKLSADAKEYYVMLQEMTDLVLNATK